MDFRDDYEYDGMDSRYAGNRNLYCDLCMRRCRGTYHVVERGDTLYSLGKRYHVSVSELMRANPYVNVYNLRIGEELCIPVMDNRPPASVMPQPRMSDGGQKLRQERMAAPEMQDERDREAEVEAEETELKRMENQFSETDTIQEVLAKTGLSMSDFVRFLAEKTD